MTDNEIIQALGHCSDTTRDSCIGCPLVLAHSIPDCMCFGILIENSFDLIKRQKAEIERLEKEVKDKERAYNDEFCLRKEWQSKCRELLRELLKEKQAIKSEAIKDFAERLKRKRIALICEEPVYDLFKVGTIDNLVKKITEVETNQRKKDEQE